MVILLDIAFCLLCKLPYHIWSEKPVLRPPSSFYMDLLSALCLD